jgi:hypothetical protein
MKKATRVLVLSSSCFLICCSEEGNDNFVTAVFFFFFSYSKEGDRSFVISRFCFATTKQNYHYLLTSSFDAAKKATTPSIFAFIATKKAIAVMVPSLSFFFVLL